MRFRQKIYAVPFLAAAARALPHVANAVNIGQGVMSIKGGMDNIKLQEQQMDQQKEQHEMQMRLQKQQMESQKMRDEAMKKSLDNVIQSSPQNAASATAATISYQKNLSSTSDKLISWENIKGFGKDVGTFAGGHRDTFYNMAAGALAATAIGYGVNKILQKDHDRIKRNALKEERLKRLKKEGNNTDLVDSNNTKERSYSIVSSIGNEVKMAGKGIGNSLLGRFSPGAVATTAVLGSGMLIANHLITRDAVKEMAKQSAKKRVDREVKKRGGKESPTEEEDPNGYPNNNKKTLRQRSYSLTQKGLGGMLLDGFKWAGNSAKSMANNKINSIKQGYSDFKSAPGEFILGKASTHVGGYSSKDNRAGTAEFKRIGDRSGNPITKYVGKFLTENPKTALIATIPIGIGVAKVVSGIPAKLMQKGISKIDKKAWSYGQSQEEEFDD